MIESINTYTEKQRNENEDFKSQVFKLQEQLKVSQDASKDNKHMYDLKNEIESLKQ